MSVLLVFPLLVLVLVPLFCAVVNARLSKAPTVLFQFQPWMASTNPMSVLPMILLCRSVG